MDARYLEKRKQIEHFFVPENIEPNSGEVDISPSGRFQIETCRYLTRPDGWTYSRGKVTNILRGDVIADIKRNYGHFWHAWVQHPNGSEYLLCGEDYQGYSVINLDTGKYEAYFSEEGYRGVGFCWVVVHPSPDGLMLAVDGCYWACSYELVIFDFRNPECLPYPEVARYDALDGCDGWIDNDTFVLRREIAIRKSDGALYEELSEAEQEVLDRDLALLDYRIEVVHFKRPAYTKD